MYSSFALRIRQTISKRGLLTPGDRVLVGVSGGADSVALARVLNELGYFIGIAHLNHALRGADSVEDERFVASLASELQAPFFFRTTEIARQPGNLEEAGRVARREFLKAVRTESGFDKIALGHSRDDRTETFLLNLTRGSGLEGLISMRPKVDSTVRPLIDEGRAGIEAYLQELGQPWRTDTTNADLAFARNRMRHRIIPELALSFNPRLTEAVARAVDVMDDEHSWMRDLTEAWLDQHGADSLRGIVVDAKELRQAPTALARRIIREGIRRAGIPLTGINFVHIERVRALALEGKSGKIAEIPGGGVVRREFDEIVFSRRVETVCEFAYELSVPGVVHAPALGKVFRASVISTPQPVLRGGVAFVDGERLGPYVRIRAWQPGDYYRPAGRPAGKLKKLFQQARIPRSQRRGWPVFETDSGIVWVASFPVSREFAPCERSQKIVALEALSESG